MKVKIIEEKRYWDLEKSINEYLSTCNCSNVLEIKYSGCGTYAPYGITYYSAMIILKQ